ncbi:uncharacterized protein FFB14_07413 [Fusarium fujikuroi]|nr:uncharacterized protein FFB14_07413 [Fusarium fujikuroi]
MNNTQSTKLKRNTVDMETLDGLCHIHILHGYRVCYPIFWEIARDSFNDLNKILGLNEAIDKILDFDYEAESSNGWSIEQKIWGVRVAIDILEDILDSPDVAEAFRLEGSAPVERPEKREKVFNKRIPRGPVDEMADLLCKVKID